MLQSFYHLIPDKLGILPNTLQLGFVLCMPNAFPVESCKRCYLSSSQIRRASLNKGHCNFEIHCWKKNISPKVFKGAPKDRNDLFCLVSILNVWLKGETLMNLIWNAWLFLLLFFFNIYILPTELLLAKSKQVLKEMVKEMVLQKNGGKTMVTMCPTYNGVYPSYFFFPTTGNFGPVDKRCSEGVYFHWR